MKTKTMKITGILLMVVMLLSTLGMFSLTASAATITGNCGTDAKYTLTDDGVLTISGTGAIEKNAFGRYAETGATLNKGFTDYLKIQKVVINEGITEVGYQAFLECSSIASVALPSTVTRIEDNAFFQCTNLKSINLPEGVTYIGTNAFYSCKNLTEITIPSTLISLGNAAFMSCTSLKTVILSEGMTATIPQNTFWRAILTDITIPASVTNLNQYAFWSASNLKNVTIKNKDITLGAQAFSASDIVFTVPCDFDKSKITTSVVNNNSFTFSDNYLHIDANNDGKCDGCGTATVASVSLSTDSITLTTAGATETLTATITPSDFTADFTWRSNNPAVATVSNGVVTAVGEGTATITVEAGGKTAKCTVTVDLPANSVTGVSLSQTSLTLAIGDTYELDAIIEPENADIKTVTWTSSAESVATVDSDGIVTGVAAGTATITVTTQDGEKTATCAVTVLESHEHTWDSYTGACGGCSLTHYTHGTYEWSNGVCSICGVTGGYCGYVGMETSVEYILTSTDNSSTYTITLSGYGNMGEYIDYNDSSNPPWYSYREKITSVIIQNGVKDIGWGAFKYHTALESVSIPSSVTEIKRAAFLGATSLTSISIPDSVTTIGQSVFKKSGLTSIEIPSGVTKIQGATFSECTQLTSVKLPNGITEIMGNSFEQCTALTSINIPNSVTSIGEWAFNQSGLTSVTIPGSVTSLGMHAFSGCPNLKTVTIDGTNLTIAERAFQGDEALETLIIKNTGIVSIGDYAFMIDAAEDDDDNVDIGGAEIEGWQPAEGGSTETEPVSLASGESAGNDTSQSQTIERREDKLYSITLPANVTYATNYATSFKNRVRSISIEETATVVIDYSITLTPVFTPDTAFDKTITWTSSDESVATVDSNGNITGVSKGEVTITATAKYQLNGESKSASCTVKVVPHTHNWTYALSANTTNTIEATCENLDGYCPNTNGGYITIAVPDSLTYTGSKIEAVVDNKLTYGATVNVKYSGSTTDGYPVNVGTYTASITMGEGDNKVTASVTYTIVPKNIEDVTITLSSNSGEYDGNAHTLTVNVSELAEGTDYTVSFPEDMTNAGEKTITVTSKGNYTGKQELSYTISPTDPVAALFSFTAPSDLTYTGTAKTATVVTKAGTYGMGTITIKYSADPINVGDYTVSIDVAAGTNFKAATGLTVDTWKFSITKAPLTVKADNKTMTTGYALPSFTYTITGFVNDEDESVLTTKPVAQTSTDGQTAGTFDITVSGAVAANYEVTYEKGTLSVVDHQHNWTYTANEDTIIATCEGENGECPVENKTVTITLVAPTNLTYDGTAKTVTVTQTPAGVFTDIPAVTYGDRINCVNCGGYTASLTYGEVTASLSFTIEKATPTIAWDNTSAGVNYTGSAAVITAPGVTLVNGETFNGTVSYSYTGTSSGSGLPINAGTYEITASIAAQGNYTAATSTNTLTLTIGSVVAPAIQWPTASGLTYGQKLSESALTSTDENGTFAWQDGSTVPNVTNNGYVVVYTPNDTDNYDYSGVELTKTITVEVSRKTVTITAENKTICVGGTYTLTYTVNGLVGSDKLTAEPILSADANVNTAGEYAIIASGATVSDNYTLHYENGTLTVRNHAYSGVVTTNPTCSAVGEKTYTCSHDSSHTYTEDVPIDGNAHAWNDGEVTTNPTCSAVGVKTYTCEHNSAHTKTEDVPIDGNAHAHGSTWKTNENEHWNECECGNKANKAEHTDGDSDGKCDTCDYTMSSGTVEPGTDPVSPGTDDLGKNDGGLGTGAIIAIAVASVAVAGGGGFALFWFVIKKKKVE